MMKELNYNEPKMNLRFVYTCKCCRFYSKNCGMLKDKPVCMLDKGLASVDDNTFCSY